jgi:membrane-bound metal-dependent hydrolase YbcI (DUF457 family)
MTQQGVKDMHLPINKYWAWFSVGLFLLTTVDLLTTFGVQAIYGVDAEINPFMKWLLVQGPLVVGAVHLVVVIAAVSAFAGVLNAVQTAPDRYQRFLARTVELWLGFIVTVGLFVFANNLAVIFLGRTLL